MLNSLKIFSLLIMAMLSCSITGYTQSSKMLVDKILGVVGDKIILQSDIQNAIADDARNNQQLSDDAPCQKMEQAILSKVLALQAERDSLPVTDDQVEAELDRRMRYFINYYGTQSAVEEIAQKSIYQLKDEQRPMVKENLLASQMQSKIVSGVSITPTEVKAYYEKIPQDSLPFLESELEVGQIVIMPSASEDVEKYIYNEMMGYKKQIEAGTTSFEALAKRLSEDRMSGERGGLMEVNRSDKTLDPIFLSTCFRLKVGEISNPVKSAKFGYFLIQQLSRTGDNARVRMILRVPPVTEEELSVARAKLDSVRAEIDSNKISFKQAAYKYSEDESIKNYGPFVLNRDGSTKVMYDMLDKDMVQTLKGMKVGEISKAVNFTNEQGKKGVRLIYLQSRTEAHRLNLNDDYTKIADAALSQKRAEELDKWLEKKMPTFYILVDKEASQQCPSLRKYDTASEKGF